MKHLNKLLIITAFLSSIAAAGPLLYAKGDPYVGTGAAFGLNLHGTACDNLDMGRSVPRFLYWCAGSNSTLSRLEVQPDFTKAKPFSYQIDISGLLAKKTWQLGPVYVPELQDNYDPVAVLYLIPVIFSILMLFLVWIVLRVKDSDMKLETPAARVRCPHGRSSWHFCSRCNPD